MKSPHPVASSVILFVFLLAGIGHAEVSHAGSGERTPSAKMPTTARIKSMEVGDRACYVQLVDKRGKKYEELADFGVCDQTKLINKWVTITRKKASVMSAACQGREDCTLSDSVDLIVGIKAVR